MPRWVTIRSDYTLVESLPARCQTITPAIRQHCPIGILRAVRCGCRSAGLVVHAADAFAAGHFSWMFKRPVSCSLAAGYIFLCSAWRCSLFSEDDLSNPNTLRLYPKCQYTYSFNIQAGTVHSGFTNSTSSQSFIDSGPLRALVFQCSRCGNGDLSKLRRREYFGVSESIRARASASSPSSSSSFSFRIRNSVKRHGLANLPVLRRTLYVLADEKASDVRWSSLTLASSGRGVLSLPSRMLTGGFSPKVSWISNSTTC